MEFIGFNKPYFTGKEVDYILEAVKREKISGNGFFTQRCQEILEKRYGVKKALLTSSCTDALEMSALLLDIKEGDEVIIPSFTFVSTANAFVIRGAKIVFADSQANHPNIDSSKIETLITHRTKAIIVVHYAGVSCDMDSIMGIAERHGIRVVEDAAQAIESAYKGRPLGSIGHLGCFSFHETKNITSGEGGALLVNDASLIARAEIIWEKGTNRSAFFRGEVDKYNWVDVGSSFLPSDVTAAFLLAQLENIDAIQERRHSIWSQYKQRLHPLEDIGVQLPTVSEATQHNAHMFYLVCRSASERDSLLPHLNKNGVNAIFHYLALHESPYYRSRYDGAALPHCLRFEKQLIRLPFYCELDAGKIDVISSLILKFYREAKM